MADQSDDSLYPIAVLIDELRNEDVQVCSYGVFFVHKLLRIDERDEKLHPKSLFHGLNSVEKTCPGNTIQNIH